MDGYITIGTKIDTSGIDSGINKITNTMNKRMSGLEKSVNKTFSLIKNSIIGAGIILAIRQITKELDSAVQRLDTMKNYTNVMGNLGIDSLEAEASIQRLSQALEGLPTPLDQAALSVQRLTAANGNIKASTEIFLAMNNAVLAGGASAQTQATAIEQLNQAYAKGKPDMMEWRTMMTAMPAQLTQVAKAMGFVNASALGESLRSGKTSMNEFMTTLVKMNKQSVNGFKPLEEQARNATGGIGTSITNLKTAITRGLANIMDAIGRSNIVAFFDAIRNAINKVIPYIQAFIRLMATGISYVAGLFGKKAKSQADSTAKSINGIGGAVSGVSSNMSDATGNAKKLNKQLKTLASFDEMNVLQDSTQTSSGSGDSGSSSGAGSLGDIDLSAFDNLGNVSDEVDKIYQKLLEFVKLFTKDMNFQPLIDSIGNLGGAMEYLVDGAGMLFGRFIDNYLKPLITFRINEDLPRFFNATADAIKSINFDKLANSFDVLYESLIGFDRTVMDLLLWFYEKVVLPLATVVINDVLPGFLELLAGAIDVLSAVINDVKPVLEFFIEKVVMPIAEFTGKALGKTLEAIGDALKWIADNEVALSILEGLAIAIGAVVTAMGLWNVVMAAYTIATGAAAAVTGVLAGAFAVLTSPITLIIAAIAAVIAIVILLIKHWDDVKAAAINVWNKIKEIWGVVANWFNNTVIKPVVKFFSGLWDGLKNGAKNAWNGVKSVFSAVGNFFKTTFTNAWNAVKAVFSTGGKIFDGIKDGIVKAFTSIVNKIIDGINKVIKIPFDGINDVLKGIKNINILGQKPFKGLISTIKVPKIPHLAKGGIINQPGRGVPVGSAIAGERGQEAVIPLTDSQQMALLGEAIGKYITVNANITNTMNGRVISRELQKIQNENNFAYNR